MVNLFGSMETFVLSLPPKPIPYKIIQSRFKAKQRWWDGLRSSFQFWKSKRGAQETAKLAMEVSSSHGSYQRTQYDSLYVRG